MTFMLGSFTQGLTQGAKDIYGLENEQAQTEATRARTAQQKQETALQKEGSDAARNIAMQASKPPAPVPQKALEVTPSNTGPAGGTPGTTNTGPVAPMDWNKQPTPKFMPQTQTASSAPTPTPT